MFFCYYCVYHKDNVDSSTQVKSSLRKALNRDKIPTFVRITTNTADFEGMNIRFENVFMVAYFCHHLSENNADFLDLYVVLSDLYVDLSDLYVDLSLIHLLEH